MRRDMNTTKDPDVEASQAELHDLEGAKSTVQTELLETAEGKQRLEESFEVRKREIEDELAIRRREAEIEKEAIDRGVLASLEEKKGIDKTIETLKGNIVSLSEEETSLQIRVRECNETTVKASNDMVRLTAQRDTLQEEVDPLLATVTEAQKKFDILTADVEILEERKKTLTEDTSVLATSYSETKIAHDTLSVTYEANKKEAATEIEKLDALVSEKKTELIAATSNLETVQKDTEKTIKESQEKEDLANKRLESATRLEATVDMKLEHLREVEKAFTTEHLLKYGYKKTTEIAS